MKSSPKDLRISKTRIPSHRLRLILLLSLLASAAAAQFTPIEWGSNNTLGPVPAGLTNVTQIAAGQEHALALTKNGTVIGWGSNGAEQIPTGLSNVVAVAAGCIHCLALKADGTVVAWGDNYKGETNVPPGLSNVVAIAGGIDYSLALRSDGRVYAWGYGYGGEVTNPILGLSNAVTISSSSVVNTKGNLTNYALLRNGTAMGWAAIAWPGSNSLSLVTNMPPTWTNLTAVAVAVDYVLAVRADGTVLAWGWRASAPYDVLPTNVPAGLSNVVAVASGDRFCLALGANGTMVGWGDNTYGQTNIPAGATNVQAICASYAQGLALLGSGPPVQQSSLVSPHFAGGSFSVSVPSQNGRVYSLEYKNSLADTTWTGLPLVAGTGDTLTLTDANATMSQRFYRVRRW